MAKASKPSEDVQTSGKKIGDNSSMPKPHLIEIPHSISVRGKKVLNFVRA